MSAIHLTAAEQATIEREGRYNRLLRFVRACMQHSCCLCSSFTCVACNAKDVLDEIGEGYEMR